MLIMTRIKSMMIEEIKSAKPIEEKFFITKTGIVFRRAMIVGIVEQVVTKNDFAVAVVSEGNENIKVYGWEDNRVAIETLPQNSCVFIDGVIKEAKKTEEKGDETTEIIMNPYFVKEIQDPSFLKFWYLNVIKIRHASKTPFPLTPLKAIIDEIGLTVEDVGDGLCQLVKTKKNVERIVQRKTTDTKANNKTEKKKSEKTVEKMTVEDYLRTLKKKTISYTDLLSWGKEHGFTDADLEATITNLVDEGNLKESEEDRAMFIIAF